MNTLPKPPINLSNASALDKLIWFLGVGLGSGLFPKAPGTMGSLAVLLLYPVWIQIGLIASIVVIIIMSLVGIYICGRSADIMQVHDDGRIVWDEFAGQSIALLPLVYFYPLFSWWWIFIGFALFRLFDIWKPFPIGWADQKVSGGLGIMLDDLLAGIMAAIVFIAILNFVSLG
ncbi:phosphatidylglycerophosphatase A family protein [Acinetobacter puyangensis]|uniref:phosphatidylglycerophosphatase A family protein n=1 Tax=Acinetobacter puyangensis TaxID=1096779 RepID=UPI000BE2ADEB|nr:phosphatidylglycerophosphatase A [Acinetobacter puyangensis]